VRVEDHVYKGQELASPEPEPPTIAEIIEEELAKRQDRLLSAEEIRLEARQAALEEAAVICDECAKSHLGDLLPEARFVAKDLAAAIRLRACPEPVEGMANG
jgi:hypothetical protein